MNTFRRDLSTNANGPVRPTGWKRSLRAILLIGVTLIGLWSIIATGGGGGGGSSSSGGTVSGSGT